MKKKILGILLIMFMVLPISFVKADEYFTANDNVNDTKEYNHSHFEAGNNVYSKSNVNGLSFVAGSVLNISGTKEYGIFAGESLKIDATIEKDLFAAGNSINISKDSNIGRDIYLAGNNISIDSNINGNAFIAGSVINLNNTTINGDAKFAANTLNIGENVEITGKLIINEDAIIQNEGKLKLNGKETYNSRGDFNFTITISDIILNILTMLFTGIMLALIFPKLFRKISYDLTAKDVCKKILQGLLVLIAVPMLVVIALTLVVGISVGVLLVLLYIASLMIASILAASVIGHNIYTKIFKQKENIYISLSVGILTIKIVELIPIIGGLVTFIVFLYGLGIICNIFLERNK